MSARFGSVCRKEDCLQFGNGTVHQLIVAPRVLLTMMTVVVALTTLSAAQVELNEGDELEILNRGPLHESFAEVHSDQPEPGIVVPKEPPPAVNEIPPEHRMSGSDVTWIPGYWGWDEERADFIWISGIWRRIPPGRRWVPGTWTHVDEKWQWSSGFWAAATREHLEYLEPPPQSLEEGPSQGGLEGEFYVPGTWLSQGDSYQWRPGYWSQTYASWCWVPHRYVWTPRGCVFRNGYWDYPPLGRCMLFAPVYFRSRHHLRPDFQYAPAHVVDCGPSLLVHLFVRPSYCHYYFGDYFAARYRQQRIYPWVKAGSRHHRHDPLRSYYDLHNNEGQRDQLRKIRGWHDYFVRHEEHRPSLTLGERNREVPEGDIQRMTMLARSMSSIVHQPQRADDFTRVSDDIRDRMKQLRDPIRTLGRERAAVESEALSTVENRTKAEPGQRSSVQQLNLPVLTASQPGVESDERRHARKRLYQKNLNRLQELGNEASGVRPLTRTPANADLDWPQRERRDGLGRVRQEQRFPPFHRIEARDQLGLRTRTGRAPANTLLQKYPGATRQPNGFQRNLHDHGASGLRSRGLPADYGARGSHSNQLGRSAPGSGRAGLRGGSDSGRRFSGRGSFGRGSIGRASGGRISAGRGSGARDRN